MSNFNPQISEIKLNEANKEDLSDSEKKINFMEQIIKSTKKIMQSGMKLIQSTFKKSGTPVGAARSIKKIEGHLEKMEITHNE